MKSCPCKTEVYCSIKCQRQHWKQHRSLCNRGRADYKTSGDGTEEEEEPDPLITTAMCQVAVSFVYEMQSHKRVTDQQPLIVLLPPLETPDKTLRLISLEELIEEQPQMSSQAVKRLLSQRRDSEQRELIHMLWLTRGKVIHKTLRSRTDFVPPELSWPDLVFAAWLTEERVDRSIGCYLESKDQSFHFLSHSTALNRHVEQLISQGFVASRMIRGVWLPGDDPDTNECFCLCVFMSSKQPTPGSDAVAQYFDIESDNSLLLRTDRCWNCYVSKYTTEQELLVCVQCHTARYCGVECQHRDWLDHKEVCVLLHTLPRHKLPVSNDEAQK